MYKKDIFQRGKPARYVERQTVDRHVHVAIMHRVLIECLKGVCFTAMERMATAEIPGGIPRECLSITGMNKEKRREKGSGEERREIDCESAKEECIKEEKTSAIFSAPLTFSQRSSVHFCSRSWRWRNGPLVERERKVYEQDELL